MWKKEANEHKHPLSNIIRECTRLIAIHNVSDFNTLLLPPLFIYIVNCS